jgi:hypothetical protein
MIKGIFLIKSEIIPNDEEIEENSEEEEISIPDVKSKVIAEFIPTSDEKPSEEIVANIIEKFMQDSTLKSTSYRNFPYKYYAIALDREEGEESYYLCYILDSSESLEIVQIADAYPQMILDKIKKPKTIVKIFEEIHSNRNRLLDKLEKTDILQKEIGASANKLIDAEKFEQAQEMIKLAKEIPSKIVSAYKKGMSDLKNGDFKKAEKSFDEILSLARKIDDTLLVKFIKLKIENTQNTPSFQKELKTLLASLKKTLNKPIALLPYQKQISTLSRCIILLDKLEKDRQIEEMAELETIIEKSAKLGQQLIALDRKLKKLLLNTK